MVNFLNLPTVQAPRNALADLSPIGNAIDGNRRNALMVQEGQRQDKELALRTSQAEQTKKLTDLEYRSKIAQRSAGVMQMAMNEKDPARKAAIVGNLYSQHPEFQQNLAAHGIDPNDHDTAAKFVIAEARGYVNPDDTQLKQLQIQNAQSNLSTDALQRKQLQMKIDQENRFNSMFDGTDAPAVDPTDATGSFAQPKLTGQTTTQPNQLQAAVAKLSPEKQVAFKLAWQSGDRDSAIKMIQALGPNAAALSKGAPAGYVWKDPNNAAAGVEQIAGYEKAVPGDVAGKIAMMNMAKDRIANTRATLERSWGVKDLAKNVAANVPFVGDLAWASGDIGIAQRDVRTGIEAALRTMTGAAAPEQEVVRYMQMFAPSVNDTQQSAKQKLDGLMRFMEDADRIVMQGRGDIGGTPSPQNQATDLKSKYGLE